MTRQELIQQIKKKKSFLSVGLDTDINKIPKHLLKSDDPIFEFNKQIIDATADFCVSYKVNTAFYESRGVKGWQSLIKTFNYLPKDTFSIADAKRGDIGNTSAMYADAFFNPESSEMNFDSVTVAPYMGKDSVSPFLKYANKWVILLALTSNDGANDFQFFGNDDGYLFEKVIRKSQEWASEEQMMYVVGATRGEAFLDIRKLAPKHFLLVPGVGAQGGSLQDVCKYGMNEDCGLIVNSSRAIIYASSEKNFAEVARNEAKKIQQEMEKELLAINF
ncbi:MAG: orotidine-5'-phosphate decarboxylase [Bacteroidetes bacterium]|nr:orotidine-5'-phosphate decarboxylase [Bacteroidota bacterium]MBU1371391.1 orotidine-5'-phosphate decarboxylase [Bacteroidota bacterium]MBU1485662.1 orotidine-5'-phosphate decarboxylase [Bacteroidota bacterium]MBU1761906.1 orotidine-5'-phosphate decarboxylase [Bacteroidota bacterium]MBU2266934.1 orotidine-5'-phosphate decarboxylase [Bacteroidota bacterium]